MNCRRKSLIICESSDFLFFSGEFFLRERNLFLGKRFTLNTQQKKNEKMQFLLGSKIGEENLWKIFRLKNFFFFWKKYISRNFFSNFGTKQKLHLFVFSLLGIYGVLLGGCQDRHPFHPLQRFVGKKRVFLNLFPEKRFRRRRMKIRPILDFCVDSPEDLNPQYWKRYIFIWPAGVPHYNIDAKPPRKPLSKPPSEAVSEVISESPED